VNIRWILRISGAFVALCGAFGRKELFNLLDEAVKPYLSALLEAIVKFFHHGL
jgi:hypothetical protein